MIFRLKGPGQIKYDAGSLALNTETNPHGARRRSELDLASTRDSYALQINN